MKIEWYYERDSRPIPIIAAILMSGGDDLKSSFDRAEAIFEEYLLRLEKAQERGS